MKQGVHQEINSEIRAQDATSLDSGDAAISDEKFAILHVSPEVAKANRRGYCQVRRTVDRLQDQDADGGHQSKENEQIRKVLKGADLPKGLPKPSEIDGTPFFTSKMLQEAHGNEGIPEGHEAGDTARSADKQDNKYENPRPVES